MQNINWKKVIALLSHITAGNVILRFKIVKGNKTVINIAEVNRQRVKSNKIYNVRSVLIKDNIN